jgi:hypothetical protein
MPGNVTVRIDVGEGTLENRTYVRASCLGLVRQEWLQDIHLILKTLPVSTKPQDCSNEMSAGSKADLAGRFDLAQSGQC